MLETAAYMMDLTDRERLMFQTEMNTRGKNPTAGLLLCLFLGGAGAHRFYLGQTDVGSSSFGGSLDDVVLRTRFVVRIFRFYEHHQGGVP